MCLRRASPVTTLDDEGYCRLSSRPVWLDANTPSHPSRARPTSGLTGLALFLHEEA